MFAARRLINVSRGGVASVYKNATRHVASGNQRTASIVTTEQARCMPTNYNEMPNDVLLSMAVMGDQEAREERLIREIMAVDGVDW